MPFVSIPLPQPSAAKCDRAFNAALLSAGAGADHASHRPMRASVAEVMNQNYIRAAKIKGLSNYQIVTQHVLRNAIPPMIPKFGVQLSSMLTLAIITESIFNWPGIGRWLLDALANRDFMSIQAGVIVVGTLVLTANILSDLIGAAANPLVRKEWYVKR